MGGVVACSLRGGNDLLGDKLHVLAQDARDVAIDVVADHEHLRVASEPQPAEPEWLIWAAVGTSAHAERCSVIFQLAPIHD